MSREVPIRAVETALKIVNLLADSEKYGVTAIAKELELPKSTVHDHLQTLEGLGYVLKSDNSYGLSSKFLEIGSRHRNQLELYTIAKPEITDLAIETDKLANLFIEENGFGVLLGLISGSTPIHLQYAYEGMHSGLHMTANGKSMLAFMPDERVSEVLNQRELPSVAPNTITDQETLMSELEEIRDRGYGLDTEESIAGMGGVAAPIFDRENTVIGSVGLYDSANNMDELIEVGSDLVQEKANIIRVNYNYLDNVPR